MKRLYVFIIVAAMLLALGGCARQEISGANGASPAAVTAAPSAFPTAQPSETCTPEPALEYTFDPYALPSDAAAYLGAAVSDYRGLVDAILARQETVALPESALSQAVSCLYCEFPLIALTSDINIDWDNSSVTFSYIGSEEDHAARLAAYEDRVEEAIRASVLPSYNACEKAVALYRWTAQNISYVDGDDVSVYHALMNGEGICQSYAGVYQLLLLQVGIDALGAGAFMSDGEAHAWTMVMLDGRWFHMDPTFEDGLDGGDGLEFFGMDDISREQSGAVAPFTTGIDEWCTTAPACESGLFADFSNCLYWDLEADAHRIRLYDGSGAAAYTAFDTAFCGDAEEAEAPPALSAPGLPDGAALVTETDGDDGTYRAEWRYDDTVFITLARVNRTESDEESVESQIGTLTGADIRNLEAAVDETLSQEFSYPVWRIAYLTGENEDTRENVDVYIQTDGMDYWFHAATPADLYEDYEDDIAAWIGSLTFS